MVTNEIIEKARQINPRAYEAWDEEEDQKLYDLYGNGMEDWATLAQEFQRSSTAIQRRLEFLDLIPMSERRVSLIKEIEQLKVRVDRLELAQ